MMLSQHNEVLVVEESVITQTPCCCALCYPQGTKEYNINDPATNHPILKGREALDVCCRKCSCFCRRDFDVKIEDPNGRQLYVMTHDRMCCTAFKWCACCRHEFQVERDSTSLGSASEDCKC